MPLPAFRLKKIQQIKGESAAFLFCEFAFCFCSIQMLLHGRGKPLPYGKRGADSPGIGGLIGESCRGVEDADPYDGAHHVGRPPVGRRIPLQGHGGAQVPALRLFFRAVRHRCGIPLFSCNSAASAVIYSLVC